MDGNDQSGDRARAQAIYETELLPKLLPTAKGKILVQDLQSGDYALGDDLLETDARLRARHPDTYCYAFRIGYPAVGRMGRRRAPERVVKLSVIPAQAGI